VADCKKSRVFIVQRTVIGGVVNPPDLRMPGASSFIPGLLTTAVPIGGPSVTHTFRGVITRWVKHSVFECHACVVEPCRLLPGLQSVANQNVKP
jgi:hypothetical protein